MEDEIAEIANRSFSLYKLGPLFKFFETSVEERRKSFAIELCKSLNLKDTTQNTRKRSTEAFDGELLEMRIDPMYFQDIESYGPEAKPIKFTIEIVIFKDQRSTVHTIFMLPASQIPAHDKEPENFAYYPLLLIKSTIRMKNIIIEWFRKHFVAACLPLHLPPSILIDVVSLSVDAICDLSTLAKSQDVPNEMIKPPLGLVYMLDDDNLSNINIEISQEEVVSICEEINNPSDFFSAFQEHVIESTHVKVDALVLSNVSSCVANIRKDGRIKISGYSHKKYAVELVKSFIALAMREMYQ